METPEQYTVKTPEEIIKNLSQYLAGVEVVYTDHAIEAMKEYSSELIKENERLRGTIGVECVKQLLEARNQNIMQSKCLSMINRCLNDGLTIEKDDPIHEVIKRLIP